MEWHMRRKLPPDVLLGSESDSPRIKETEGPMVPQPEMVGRPRNVREMDQIRGRSPARIR